MSIRLEGRCSTDGLGVKRWTYRLDESLTLHVFERPQEQTHIPYLLRLDHADGRTLDVRYARFRSQAVDKAQWIALRVEQGEFKGRPQC